MPAEFTMDMPVEAASPQPPAIDAPVVGDGPPDAGSFPASPDGLSHHIWDVDADGDSPEPAPQRVAPPPPPDPSGPSLGELQAQLEEARKHAEETSKKLETFEQRHRDTQQWGNQAHMARSIAEATVQAQQYQDQIQAQLRARQAAAQPPQIDYGDPDDLLSDPKKLTSVLQRSNQEYAQWAYQRAIGDMTPHVAHLTSQLQQVEMARPLIEHVARTLAKDMLVANGTVDADQADKLLDRALTGVINNEQNANAMAYRLQPEALVYAANIVIQRDGAPIKAKPKATPSAGTGDSRPVTKKPQLSANADRARREAEKLIGRKFNDDELQELDRMNRRA